jgi:hypothetical protein
MRIATPRFLAASPLLAATLLLTGCQQWNQLKAVLGDRPSIHMPARPAVQLVDSGQNWSPQQVQWFHHAGQGAEIMPYSWFLALEQPKLKPFGSVGRFSDPAYLAGFGFLPEDPGPGNPDGLPVGFTQEMVVDPYKNAPVQIAGLTCAACHTGQLEFHGKGVRVEGGTASANVVAFQTELGFAVLYTDLLPWRFDRFAKQVLGPNATSEQKKELHADFDKFFKAGFAESSAATKRNIYAAQDGFGRIDALARIGNYVFATELGNDANLSPADAPVKLPPLWHTSWFSWVQYNNSIQQPMMRNIGEALGVRAPLNLTNPARLYQSTVNVTNLWKMEGQLAGPTAFNGLQPPPWPAAVFGAIDTAKAQHGAEVYKQRCEGCHLPPLNSPEIQQDKYWEPGLAGHRFLKLKVIPLDEIGTDPRQALDWANRTADTGALGLGTVPASVGTRAVTAKVRDLNYDALGLTPEQRLEWNGYRDDGVTAPLGYAARPLTGLWATPPFLHNGSVVSLYELLLPANQRRKVFFTGSREFDPLHVGYDPSILAYGFTYRTDQLDDPHPGNSNAGHQFSNTPGKGVLGPELSEEDRWALIEYLKTL